MKIITAVDIGDIKTNFLVDCQYFVHNIFVYGRNWLNEL